MKLSLHKQEKPHKAATYNSCKANIDRRPPTHSSTMHPTASGARIKLMPVSPKSINKQALEEVKTRLQIDSKKAPPVPVGQPTLRGYLNQANSVASG